MAYKAKRQFKRAELVDGVKLQTGVGVEFVTFDNVSAGGLRIHSEYEMKTGAYLEASFTVRSGCDSIHQEVSTLCRVVRCKMRPTTGYDIGLQFLNLNNEAHKQLQSFCGTEQGPF
jgi:c-di-GMP-binding flagellar brake protein YcgR